MTNTECEFKIYIKESQIDIENIKLKKFLSINISNPEIPDISIKVNLDYGSKIIPCFGILGILSFNKIHYLLYISDRKILCQIKDSNICEILSIDFLLLSNDESLVTENIKDILSNIKEIYQKGFYFSNSYDLSNSLTCQFQIISEKEKKEKKIIYNFLKEGNKNFLANNKLIDKFIDVEYTENFICSCIYGFIARKTLQIQMKEEEKIENIIISRRYLFNFGINAFKRGLGKYGNLSNQIETEYIIIHNNLKIYSYIILLGNIPVYYNLSSGKKNNKVNKSFKNFIKNIVDEYNLICFITVHDEKEKDFDLVENFKTLIIGNKEQYEQNIKFFMWDYMKNPNLALNERIEKIIKLFNFFEDINTTYNIQQFQKILKNNFNRQYGIFHINGINFDKINDIAMFITFNVINIIFSNNPESNFKSFIQTSNFEFHNNFSDKLLSSKNENQNDNKFTAIFKFLWQSNISFLQNQYSKKLIQDQLRKYQRCLEILFNYNLNKTSLQNSIQSFKESFSIKNKINIYIATWNTGVTNVGDGSKVNLYEMLVPKDTKIHPDIYLIGFQEVVKLNAVSVVWEKNNKILLENWCKKIETVINNSQYTYNKISEMNLVGIIFYVYVRNDRINEINESKIIKKTIKTGLGGVGGNKGSLIFSFMYNNTTISVCCSHLCSTIGKNQNRINELKEILNTKLFQNSINRKNSIKEKIGINKDLNNFHVNERTYSSSNIIPKEFLNNGNNINNHININPTYTNNYNLNNNNINNNFTENNPEDYFEFKNSDIWFIFGDLNFRIDIDYENLEVFVRSGENWKKLVEYDQFTKSKNAFLYLLETIDEYPISFPPTYKYCLNSNEYDYTIIETEGKKSGKKRNPSWCDRIFFKKYKNEKDKIIKCLDYNCSMDKNFQSSDHRPLYGLFEVTVLKENEELKNQIVNEIKFNYEIGISSEYKKKNIFFDN